MKMSPQRLAAVPLLPFGKSNTSLVVGSSKERHTLAGFTAMVTSIITSVSLILYQFAKNHYLNQQGMVVSNLELIGWSLDLHWLEKCMLHAFFHGLHLSNR